MTTRRLFFTTMAAACVLAVAGCGSNQPRPQAQGVFENISARHQAKARAGGIYQSVADAMPQVRYTINDGAPVSVADAYVVGPFVSAEPGPSFRWTEDNETGETRHELDFNAEDAMTSHVHLTLQIKRSIIDPNQPESVQRELAAGKTVTLGLALDAPAEITEIRDRFKGQSLVALLYKPSPVFDYDPSLWAILEDGAFLGHTSSNGRDVTFPALESDHDRKSAFSFEELERPSDKPKRVKYDQRSGYTPEPSPDDVPASTER